MELTLRIKISFCAKTVSLMSKHVVYDVIENSYVFVTDKLTKS